MAQKTANGRSVAVSRSTNVTDEEQIAITPTAKPTEAPDEHQGSIPAFARTDLGNAK
jgi:hypothetical protein